MEIVFTLDELNKAAKEFLHYAGNRKVFAFTGQMGAGKTTFINAVCNVLGVTEAMGSPTFFNYQ